MKIFIKTLLLSSFFLNLAGALEKMPLKTEEELVKELNKKKNLSLEDFEHINKGCPENSDCSVNMGKQRTLWLNLFKSFPKSPVPSKESKDLNHVNEIEKFRKENGIPVEFYTNSAGGDRFSPILFDSSCEQHNPKKDKKGNVLSEEKVLIGTSFVKNTKDGQVHLNVLDTKYDIPLGELAYFDPLYIISPKSSANPAQTTLYWVPHGEKPLYIEGNSIVLLREQDNFYYGLKIFPNGEWQVTEIKPGQGLDEKINEETCQKNEIIEKYKGSPEFKKYYLDQFCQSIYDIQSKSLKTMALFWSCS